MSSANIELYEVLKGLGVDPIKARAASVSPAETGLRDIEGRIDALDTRLRKVEADIAGLKVMARIQLAGIAAILVTVLLPILVRWFGAS